MCIFDTCLTQLYNYSPATKSSNPGVFLQHSQMAAASVSSEKEKTVICKLEKNFLTSSFHFFFTNILVSPWLKRFKIDKLHSLRPVYPVQDIVLKNLINLHLRESSGLPPHSHSSQLTMQAFSLWSTILMVPKSQF